MTLTEATTIPTSWKFARLAEVCDCLDSMRIPISGNLRESRKGPYPYCGANGVLGFMDDFIFDDDLVLIAEDGGNFGEFATRPIAYRMQGKFWVNNHAHVLKAKNVADTAFLHFSLEHKDIREFLSGGTRAKLNRGELDKITIACPPLAEQKAIGRALEDVDALIFSLDALIAKKRDIKQGAMQQLLTGKTRLPGFSGEWNSTSLDRLGEFRKGRGIRKDDVLRYGHPCVRYGEIYTRFSNTIQTCYSFISEKTARDSEPLMKGDVVFAVSGETSEDIGKCATFVGDFEAYVGSDTLVLRPKGNDPTFLGYFLNFGEVLSQKQKLGQGDAVVHLSLTNLLGVTFEIPQLPEQSAIAEVLSDMDAEIAALVARREKTTLIKTGMMQELLTGRTRLL